MSGADLSESKPAAPGVTAQARKAARALFSGPAGGLGGVFVHALDAVRGQLVAAVARAGKPEPEAVLIVDAVLLPELKAHAGALTDALAEVYAAHFTVAELEELRALQQTALGQKAMALAGQIGLQTRAATQAWSRQVGHEALAKHADALKRQGVVLQTEPVTETSVPVPSVPLTLH